MYVCMYVCMYVWLITIWAVEFDIGLALIVLQEIVLLGWGMRFTE